MDKSTIREKLIAVLLHIQQAQKYPAPVLTGATRPMEDLQGFDSPLAVSATSRLAAALGIEIPAGRNIFREKGGTRALTIDEIVEVVLELASTGAQKGGSAAAATGSATP